MKNLKLYEDFDFDEDNFDEEEFDDTDISVGDTIIVKGNYYYKSKNTGKWHFSGDDLYEFEESKNETVMSRVFIVMEIKNHRGIKIMKIRWEKHKDTTNWPWYICEYWKKIN